MTHYTTVGQLLKERKTKTMRIEGAREELKEQEVLAEAAVNQADRTSASIRMGYWLGVAHTLEAL